MPPSTPGRGRPRARTPAPELRPFIYRLPLFWLGALCAAFVVLAGFSIMPNAGHVGIRGVQAKEQVVIKVPAKMGDSKWWGHSSDYAEHMTARVKCGLPKMTKEEFRCDNGVFMGDNPVITDLGCEFTLMAIHDGESYDLDVFDAVPLIKGGMPVLSSILGVQVKTSDEIVKEKAKEAGLRTQVAASIWVRWRKFVKPAGTFSLHNGRARMELSEALKKKFWHGHYHGHALGWRTMAGFDQSNMKILETQVLSIYEDGVDIHSVHEDGVELYPAKFQYTCVNNQPKLTLTTHDREHFYGISMNLDEDFESSSWILKYLNGISKSDGCKGSRCVYSWQASAPNTKGRSTLANPELHVVAKLLDPHVNHKGEL